MQRVGCNKIETITENALNLNRSDLKKKNNNKSCRKLLKALEILKGSESS